MHIKRGRFTGERRWEHYRNKMDEELDAECDGGKVSREQWPKS